MRKLVSFVHASLDGFVAGPKGEMDWIAMDEEAMAYGTSKFEHIIAAVYGRTVYEMMLGYWPGVLNNPNAPESSLKHARWVENIPKIVVSTTLDSADWNNTTLIKGNLKQAFNELKQQPGGDMFIFGSPGLTHSLIAEDLVDEYLIFLNPIVLGDGIPHFEQVQQHIKLQLVETHQLKSGVLVLRYTVKRG